MHLAKQNGRPIKNGRTKPPINNAETRMTYTKPPMGGGETCHREVAMLLTDYRRLRHSWGIALALLALSPDLASASDWPARPVTIIVNVVGDKILSAQLPRFLELDMWLNESFELEQVTVERNRVVWTKSITAPFYEHISVAPIRFAFAADVRNGKIKSIVAHVPPEEIARIESACRQRTPEPRIYGNPCSAFIQWMKAESALAIAGTATSGSARDPVEMRVE
jgi:hypothetical protein